MSVNLSLSDFAIISTHNCTTDQKCEFRDTTFASTCKEAACANDVERNVNILVSHFNHPQTQWATVSAKLEELWLWSSLTNTIMNRRTSFALHTQVCEFNELSNKNGCSFSHAEQQYTHQSEREIAESLVAIQTGNLYNELQRLPRSNYTWHIFMTCKSGFLSSIFLWKLRNVIYTLKQLSQDQERPELECNPSSLRSFSALNTSHWPLRLKGSYTPQLQTVDSYRKPVGTTTES